MLLRVFANLYVRTVLLGCTFEACGEVHGVTHHGVVLTHGRTHVTRHYVTRVDTDTHVHVVHHLRPLVAFAGPLLAEFHELALHVARSATGALGVVLERHGRAEERDDGVAFVLVERTLVAQ